MASAMQYVRYIPLSSFSRLGVEAHGVDFVQLLSRSNDEQALAVRSMQKEIDDFGLIVFRNQSNKLAGSGHVALAALFGKPFELPTRYQHPKSPHPNIILPVSNVKEEGKTGVGVSAWHIDGLTYSRPFSHSVYRIHCVPQQGSTHFMLLADLADRLLRDLETMAWDKLTVCILSSEQDAKPILHPLIFTHPRTLRRSVCLHTGKVNGFVLHRGAPNERAMGPEETASVLDRLKHHIDMMQNCNDGETVDGHRSFYSHKWCNGDLIVSDNLSVAHMASTESQLPVEEVGLRVMHRIVIAGENTLSDVAASSDDGGPITKRAKCSKAHTSTL